VSVSGSYSCRQPKSLPSYRLINDRQPSPHLIDIVHCMAVDRLTSVALPRFCNPQN